jgi:predicted nucleic acid-binding protein
MNDRYFVDTDILVYAFDRFSGVKHARANAVVSELLSSGRGVVSTQVLQEFGGFFAAKGCAAINHVRNTSSYRGF